MANGNRLGNFRAHVFGFFICTAGLLFGYDTGIVGGVLTFKSYQTSFRYHDKTTVSAVMVSLQSAAAFVGCLAVIPVNERIGRKPAIQLAMALFCAGVILQVVPSRSLACFYVGRIVSGLGLGASTSVVPAYSAENAPKEIRAKLGSGVQLLFTVGVMISYWIDYGMAFLKTSNKQWQIPVGLQIVPAAVLGIGLFFLPESVRWLVKRGRTEEAWKNLVWLRADDGPLVQAEFEEIKVGLATELAASNGFKSRELLEPANRYRLALAIGIFLGQQCTGMTALAYFAPQFFKLLVGGGNQDLLITGLFGAQKFITCGTYIIFASERWNRRPTFYVSAFFMAICFMIVTVVNKTTPAPKDNHATSAGAATVAMIFITNSIYQFSWGPLAWPYTTEIFPSGIREIGTSVGVSTQWMFNTVFSVATPYMIAAWGSYTFIFYAGLDVLMGVLVIAFLKETRGRSLEEMETIFNSKARFNVEEVRRQAIEGSGLKNGLRIVSAQSESDEEIGRERT